MKYYAFALLLVMFGVMPCQAAAPPQPQEPLQAVVVSGRILSTLVEGDTSYFTMVALGGYGPVHNISRGRPGSLSERWTASYGGLWIREDLRLDCFGNPSGYNPPDQYMIRWDLTEFLKGNLREHPSVDVLGTSRAWFAKPEPIDNVITRCLFVKYRTIVYQDYLPIGPYRMKQFILTNQRGSHLNLRVSEEEKKYPQWSLTVHDFQGGWDSKTKAWKLGKWVKEETIELGFYEDFRVLGKGDDYFFLTSSGKLFYAPKAEGEKPRQIFALWNDPRRRIKAIIKDVDSRRTFFFVGPEKPGSKPAFFELSKKIQLVEYDAKSARKFKAPGTMAPLLRYVDVLLRKNRLEIR